MVKSPALGRIVHGERIASLDLLRGLAAFAVMVPHFYMYSSGGLSALAEVVSVTAVEVFFVLSGFVLGSQIVLCAERHDIATLRTFLVRRWMRTIPSYLVALLAISILFAALGSVDSLRYATYTQNLFAQHNERDYFPVAWSLSVEEWYYIVFPIFLLAFCKALRRRTVGIDYFYAALIFIAAISLGRLFFGNMNDWGAQVRRVVVFRIDSIAYGFILYLVLMRANIAWDRQSRIFSLMALTGTTSILIYCNVNLAEGGSDWLKQLHPFASAAFGMSTIAFFLSFNSVVSGSAFNAISGYLGRISYPVYLFHLIVLYVITQVLQTSGIGAKYLIYVASVVMVSTLFNYGFEKPLLALRPRYRSSRDRSEIVASVKVLQ